MRTLRLGAETALLPPAPTARTSSFPTDWSRCATIEKLLKDVATRRHERA